MNHKPLILAVEDDRPVRTLIATTLKAHGYRHLEAATGEAALMEASSHNPDIILCLAQVAYDRYVDKFHDDTKIYYDTEMVTPKEGAKGEHIGYDFRAMSIELGNMQTANTIALGVMLKELGLHRDAIMSAIAARFAGKDKVIAINDKALDLGLSLK